MRVLIGGGSGFVGQSLSQLLRKKGHKVTIISRKPGEQRITWVDVTKKGLPPCDAVVNLAGENVLNPLRRWTEQFKQEVIASRIETTRTLSEAIAKSEIPPHSWVLVTGVGYYPPSQTQQYTEDSPGGDADFLSRLVKDWEDVAQLPLVNGKSDTQLTKVRSGVVLGRSGGALPTMLWPFRLCLGGTLGSGRQPFPWIHIDDLCRLLCHTIEQEGGVGGVLNAVSPSSVSDTNADFTRALGKALGRPTLLFTPAFAVQLLLGSDRAPMLLEGQKVVPERTLQSGFNFLYPDLDSALAELLS
ncbi:PREDICTED: epimerase family protein SDR39U1 [Nanorana parkeri]|uniref:epimerase family protein SDR39U1 n=1 Tax=Nanorana parkeri TaxID=125878 RepID=UPI0008549437|nr:PREDICTED: epimerase family protein SDR39U1 [Nanorana parkeri]